MQKFSPDCAVSCTLLRMVTIFDLSEKIGNNFFGFTDDFFAYVRDCDSSMWAYWVIHEFNTKEESDATKTLDAPIFLKTCYHCRNNRYFHFLFVIINILFSFNIHRILVLQGTLNTISSFRMSTDIQMNRALVTILRHEITIFCDF